MSILRNLQKTKEKDDCESPEFTIAKELVNEQIQVENDEGKGTHENDNLAAKEERTFRTPRRKGAISESMLRNMCNIADHRSSVSGH